MFTVIAASPGFCVVNKPPDVAMDAYGQEEGKLTVQGWVASPVGQAALIAAGALPPLPRAADVNAEEQKQEQKQQQRQVDVDGTLRFVHQLDYATSGLLCLTFAKRIAQKLAFCFESRQTRKEYLALVYGWVGAATHLPREKGCLPLITDDAGGVAQAAADVSPIPEAEILQGLNLTNVSALIARGLIMFPIGYDPSDERGFRMRAAGVPTSPPSPHVSTTTTEAANAAAEQEEKNNNTNRARDGDTTTSPKSAATIMSVVAHGFLKLPCKEKEEIAVGQNNDDDDVQGIKSQSPPPPRTKVSLVHLQLLTGRRHQLRVHCASIGCPIVGDTTYAVEFEQQRERIQEIPRMMLHAWRLAVPQSAVTLAASAREEKQQHKARRREIKQVRSAAAQSVAAASSNNNDEEQQESRVSFIAPESLTQYFQHA